MNLDNRETRDRERKRQETDRERDKRQTERERQETDREEYYFFLIYNLLIRVPVLMVLFVDRNALESPQFQRVIHIAFGRPCRGNSELKSFGASQR